LIALLVLHVLDWLLGPLVDTTLKTLYFVFGF
jgi:hypothetical protein